MYKRHGFLEMKRCLIHTARYKDAITARDKREWGSVLKMLYSCELIQRTKVITFTVKFEFLKCTEREREREKTL
jgi:hypothetical protein